MNNGFARNGKLAPAQIIFWEPFAGGDHAISGKSVVRSSSLVFQKSQDMFERVCLHLTKLICPVGRSGTEMMFSTRFHECKYFKKRAVIFRQISQTSLFCQMLCVVVFLQVA